MICNSCNLILPQKAFFCPSCGEKLCNQEEETLLDPLIVSEDHYQDIFYAVNESFIIAKLLYDESSMPYDFEVVEFNNSAKNLFNLKNGRIEGICLSDFLKNSVPAYFPELLKVIDTGIPGFFETHITSFNTYYRISASKYKQDYLLLILKDISDRKSLEKALMEKSTELNTLFELLEDAVLLVDVDNHSILKANNATCNFFQLTKEEIKEFTFENIFHPCCSSMLSATLFEKEKVKDLYVEIPCIRKDRSIFYVDLTKKFIKYKEKDCLLVYLCDVSADLETAAIKKSFSQSLAHDIRVPFLAENKVIKNLFGGKYGLVKEDMLLPMTTMLLSKKYLLGLLESLIFLCEQETLDVGISRENCTFIEIFDSINLYINFLNEKFCSDFSYSIQQNIARLFVNKNEIGLAILFLLVNLFENAVPTQKIELNAFQGKDDLSSYVIIEIESAFKIDGTYDINDVLDCYQDLFDITKRHDIAIGFYLFYRIILKNLGKVEYHYNNNSRTVFRIMFPGVLEQ